MRRRRSAHGEENSWAKRSRGALAGAGSLDRAGLSEGWSARPPAGDATAPSIWSPPQSRRSARCVANDDGDPPFGVRVRIRPGDAPAETTVPRSPPPASSPTEPNKASAHWTSLVVEGTVAVRIDEHGAPRKDRALPLGVGRPLLRPSPAPGTSPGASQRLYLTMQ